MLGIVKIDDSQELENVRKYMIDIGKIDNNQMVENVR
jgi:hypothetical protein